MNRLTITMTTLFAAFVAACVTINVYFPEAAAVEAADRIIEKVIGDADSGASLESTPRQAPVMLALAQSFVSLLVSDANAQSQVDFDKPSPEKLALENSLAARFPSLKPYFDSGAIGVTESSVIEFRDRNLVPLKDRNTVVQLVSAQNNDWNALYAEIAKLNGHPEWQDSIRETFAERWIAKANKGWWYREGGTWKQK